MAKIMRKKNFKIQILTGNRLKIHVGAGFEISLTLAAAFWTNLPKSLLPVPHSNENWSHSNDDDS